MKIVQHRHIDVSESFDVNCRLADHRVVEKGEEIDIICTLDIAGLMAWECVITFYSRGRFGLPAPNDQARLL